MFIEFPTGATPYGVSTELSTFHTQRLYITVLAWNHAGMESLVYGGPYVVDFTPPELAEGGGVWDGMGGDLDYQSSTTLQVDWSDVVDPESGVEECTYSIGEIYRDCLCSACVVYSLGRL